MNDQIFVTKSSMPPFDEYCEEIKTIWDTCWLTNFGDKYTCLRSMLSEHWKTPNIELFVNGHSALVTGIQVLGLKGEVITTPYTFASTTHAIVQNGLIPVFCDIKEDDFTIDEDKIEELITPNTSAILAVHVYGQPCNVQSLQKIADAHGLKLIYDAAHAFGVSVNGKPIAAYGDMSMFSFHATKVFNTIEGGALVYSNKKIGNLLRQLQNFGLSGEDSMFVGGNQKISEFSAAMGICNLRHYAEYINLRQRVYQLYKEGLDGLDGIRAFAYADGDFTKNYAYYPIVVNPDKIHGGRDTILGHLDKQGIHARKYFYPLTCDFSCYSGLFQKPTVPVARAISDNVLCLPMYADLEEEQIGRICDVIRDAVKSQRI